MTRYLFGAVVLDNQAIRRIGRTLTLCEPPFDNSRVVGNPELIVILKRVHAIWRRVALPSSRGL